MERKISLLGDDELNKIDELLGEKFEEICQIGKGGQKQVYLIRTKSRGDLVLKVVFITSDSMQRLQREVRAALLINHPNVPSVVFTNANDDLKANSIVWIIESYICGNNLREDLKKGKKYSLGEIVLFLDTMFSILKKSEEVHIVHRDIKPENIMVDHSRQFYLIDFGISRHLDLESLTATDAPFGPCTIGYAASEQLRNRKKDIDIRADLFSVAVVVTEMITGSNPYTKDAINILQIVRNIDLLPLPAIHIPGDSQFLLTKFIKAMGDNRPSRRPSSVSEAIDIFRIVKETLIY